MMSPVSAHPPNVLISSGGRRVTLAMCFSESLRQRGSEAWVGTIDSGATAPLSYCAERAWRVPRCSDPGFADAVLELCARESVRLIVPTIDPELPVYAENRDRFAREGVTVAVSDRRAVAIACDKVETHRWLTANGFPTVRQAGLLEVLQAPADWQFPVIAKPSGGSASVGIRIAATLADLESLAEIDTPYIVQEIAKGREFTINVYVDRSGACIAAVPHWRLEVRAGEVSKGLTVKNPELMKLGGAIAEALPGAYGALNIQGFYDERDGIRVIEINARFGGGYPLAHRAAARFTDWLIDELEGTQIDPYDGWVGDLAMLRFDDAVFVPGWKLRA